MPIIETLIHEEDAERLGKELALHIQTTGQKVRVIWGEDKTMRELYQ